MFTHGTTTRNYFPSLVMLAVGLLCLLCSLWGAPSWAGSPVSLRELAKQIDGQTKVVEAKCDHFKRSLCLSFNDLLIEKVAMPCDRELAGRDPRLKQNCSAKSVDFNGHIYLVTAIYQGSTASERYDYLLRDSANHEIPLQEVIRQGVVAQGLQYPCDQLRTGQNPDRACSLNGTSASNPPMRMAVSQINDEIAEAQRKMQGVFAPLGEHQITPNVVKAMSESGIRISGPLENPGEAPAKKTLRLYR